MVHTTWLIYQPEIERTGRRILFLVRGRESKRDPPAKVERKPDCTSTVERRFVG